MSADWMLVRIVVIVVGGVRIERYANEKQVIIREKTLDMRWGRGYIGIESVRENRHSEGLSDRPQESRCRILRLRIGLINTFCSWRRQSGTDPYPVPGVGLSVDSTGEFVARVAGYAQHGPRKAALTAVSRRPFGEPILAAWAHSFIFGGSSALLLLVANLFPDYWYFSLFARTPFLFRIIKATPGESLRLGLLFGLAFFGASATGWLGISPSVAVVRLVCGTALLALFGWTIGWARQRWGFNPSMVALLWVGLEFGLGRLGFVGGLLGGIGFSHPILHGLAGLFGLLAASAIIVLLNSLLALALARVIKATRTGVRTGFEDARTWDILLAFDFPTEKTYLVPEGRAPPILPHGCLEEVWSEID